jgi:hypothetical protein
VRSALVEPLGTSLAVVYVHACMHIMVLSLLSLSLSLFYFVSFTKELESEQERKGRREKKKREEEGWKEKRECRAAAERRLYMSGEMVPAHPCAVVGIFSVVQKTTVGSRPPGVAPGCERRAAWLARPSPGRPHTQTPLGLRLARPVASHVSYMCYATENSTPRASIKQQAIGKKAKGREREREWWCLQKRLSVSPPGDFKPPFSPR